MSETPRGEDGGRTCPWCGNSDVELIDDDLADGFCAAYHAPSDRPGEGSCLTIPYGEYCESCFWQIRDEWVQSGSITRPATAWGAR